MRLTKPARLLELHCDENEKWQGRPLYEAIVDRAKAMGIAGATVLRGLEGFGETAELHRRHLIHGDQPIVITMVDSAENLARLIPELETMMHTGLIASSDVECLRVEKPARPKT